MSYCAFVNGLPADATDPNKAYLEVMGGRQEDLDILIAATASAHGLTLVTRNTRHFIDTGVPLINPWGGADAASTE